MTQHLTGDSHWRMIGDLPYDQFLALIPTDSPMRSSAAKIYTAVEGYSALYAAHAGHESQWAKTGVAKNQPELHNALGNKDREHGGYMQFDSWVEGASWWKQHVLTYPDYTPTATIAEYVHVYAPWQDGNDEGQYVNVICEVGSMATATQRGHVPRPPWISRYEIGLHHNIGEGRSEDAPRAGHIVGSCVHTSQGTFLGNLDSYLNPSWGGLTDAQVGGPWDGQYDGVLMVFIDPAGKVVPWANGGIGPNCSGCVPPHGDGPAYLEKFGYTDYAVNGRLRSIETTDGGDPTVAKGGRQIESLCFYLAYVHSEEAGQSWDEFAWRMSHWEFGGNHQQCPGDWIKGHEVYVNDRTISIMKAYQTKTPLAVPLVVTYPPGWTGPKVPLPEAGGSVVEYAEKHPVVRKTLNVNSRIYWSVGSDSRHYQSVKLTKDATPLEFGAPDAKPTGAKIKAGTVINISHVVIGDDGELYVVGTGGSRLPASAFV